MSFVLMPQLLATFFAHRLCTLSLQTAHTNARVCVALSNYANDMAVPAFARRPLLLSASHAAIDRYLLPTGHTAANLQQCANLGQTDGQTD